MTSSAEQSTSFPFGQDQEATDAKDRTFAVILVVIFVIGVSGNVASMITYLGSRRLRMPANLFIVSLGCADLVTLFCIPFIVYNVLYPPYLVSVSGTNDLKH
jgi:Na+/serine symporter